MSSRALQLSTLVFLAVARLHSVTLDEASESSPEFWNTLGTIQQGQSKLVEAEQDYRRALTLNHSLRVPNKTQEVSILNNLATVRQVQRDFSGAELLLKSAYAILLKNSLMDAPSAGPLLANLALNLQQQGRMGEAERAYGEAELSFEHSLTTDTAAFAMLLSNFGLLRLESGHCADAIAHERRSIEIQSKHASIPNQQRSYVFNSLGLAFEECGDFGEAKSYFLRAGELDSENSATSLRQRVEVLTNLGTLEQKLGQFREARETQLKAEEIAVESLPPNDPVLATIWNNLGSLSTQQKDFKDAAKQYGKSAALWLQTLGPNSPQYATTLSNIGSLESLRGHHKQAQEMATRALAIDRAYFGPNHPHLAADLANLGDEYFYRNKADRAIELFLEAAGIQEKAFGPDSLSLARILDNLAAAYQKAKRLVDAKVAYEKAIRIFELQQPAVAPQFAVCLHHYASLLRSMQDFGNAEVTEVRAMRLTVQSALSGQPTATEGGLAFVQ